MKLFWQKRSLIITNVLLFHRDMAIKYIKNSVFVHTKIIYVRSSCNYIISEFGIIEVFIISVNKCLVLVSEIPFWIQLLSKDGSLRGLFQKYCCVGIDWPGLWVGLSGFWNVGSLTKLLRQFMSQNVFIKFLSIPTLKSPVKKKLS